MTDRDTLTLLAHSADFVQKPDHVSLNEYHEILG